MNEIQSRALASIRTAVDVLYDSLIERTSVESDAPLAWLVRNRVDAGIGMGWRVDPATLPPPVNELKDRYRHQQPLLFQGYGAGVPGIPGRGFYAAGHQFGPTAVYVDALSGWRWLNKGGDWVDADLTPQGSKPWAVALQTGTMVKGETQIHTLDVTALAKRPGWMAWLIRCPNAERRLIGTGAERPGVMYTYEDGTTDFQVATVVAANGGGSTVPDLRSTIAVLPCMVEFKRPVAPIKSAELTIVITGGEWLPRGGPARFEVFPLIPPLNRDAPTSGLASDYPLDLGVNAHPQVIHAHRYVADASLSDFVSDHRVNTDDERNFDPGLIAGTGASDLTKLPHVGLGKWVGITKAWSYVRPGDAGFEPLHPDLGAIRVSMRPDQIKGANGELRDIQTGDVAGYGGTLSSHAFLFLPPGRIYTQPRLFTRHYMRLSYPRGRPTPASRIQCWADKPGGQAKWNDLGGKFGLTPGGHHNGYGGYSGTAGGPRGTQFRSGWIECAEGIGGPGEGGWYVSWHLYDYAYNPPGYNYGASLAHEYAWGQRGGLGSVIYAGHWYCIEQECLLNSVDGDQWLPDGELRTWLDGRLVYERTGMVFRTLPVLNAPFKAGTSRPITPLGHVYAGMNIFHGGVTDDSVYRDLDITGVVVAESRIGPMAGL